MFFVGWRALPRHAWSNVDSMDCPRVMFEEEVAQFLHQVRRVLPDSSIIEFFELWRFILLSLQLEVINQQRDDGSSLLSCIMNFCLDVDLDDLMEREFARMAVDFVKRVDLKPGILNSSISPRAAPGYALEREARLPIFWLSLRGKKRCSKR